jgi:hypothetical protein
MRETFPIFRKDVRALWPQVLIALAAAALPMLNVDSEHADKVTGLLALARWYLVVCAIHQEKLVSDREWWLTSPYSWKSLLAAKALFIVAFVQLPLLFSDLAILAQDRLTPDWHHLAMRQALLALALIVPAAALAALTEGLVTFGLSALVIVMLMAILIPQNNSLGLTRWGSLMWIPNVLVIAALALASVGLLLWQYSSRRTWPARAILGATTLCCAAVFLLPPAGWAIAVAGRPSPVAASVRIAWDHSSRPTSYLRNSGSYVLTLPVRITGVPRGMLAEPEMVEFSIEAQDGTRWSSGWRPVFYWVQECSACLVHWSHWTWTNPNEASVRVSVDRAFVDRVRNQRTTWRVSTAIAVLGAEHSDVVNPSAGVYDVPGFGVCSPVPPFAGRQMFHCRNSAPPSEEFALSWTDFELSHVSRWIRGLSLADSPVWNTTITPPPEWKGPAMTFLIRKRVAYIRRDVAEQIGWEDYRQP